MDRDFSIQTAITKSKYLMYQGSGLLGKIHGKFHVS